MYFSEQTASLLRDSAFIDLDDVLHFIVWFMMADALSHWDRTRFAEAKAIVASLERAGK